MLEGESLRERLSGGPVPVRKAVDWAVQIARGLAAAHEKGIVHRDLKPENVFITSDGRAKILDFGLAKLTQPEPALAGISRLPTTPPNTVPGVVLGTLEYMAPEQVRGLTADHRSDIFALGAVLYEMITGQRAFRGDTAADTMTAILKEDPPDQPVSERNVPPALRRIVDRCLEKSPSGRFQTASDLAFALEVISAQSGSYVRAIEQDEAAKRSRRGITREAVAWVVAGSAALVAATLAVRSPKATLGDVRAVCFTIAPPVNVTFQVNVPWAAPAVSPDGRHIAFVAQSGGANRLWVRSFDSLDSRMLAGTEGAGAGAVFWSPDSHFIGFVADGKIKKVEITGTPPQVVCDAPSGGTVGITWGRDGVILFAPASAGPLFQVSASGGSQPKPFTKLDASRKESAHRVPQFLPDGRHFLYLAQPGNTIFVGSLDSESPKPLLVADSTAMYTATGHLLSVRQGTLFAQPFNATRREVTAEPFPIAEGIWANPAGSAAFSISENGVLVYRTATAASSRLEWFDRAGKPLGTVGEEADYTQFSLSPDGRQIVAGRRNPLGSIEDLWLLDVMRGVSRRLTSDPGSKGNPIWSPDGRFVAFNRTPKGVSDIFEKSVIGTEDRLLLESAESKFPEDWSRDGKFLVYGSPVGGRVIGILPLVGDRKPFVFVEDRFAKDEPHFSPDGRWLAYESDESGQFEVYVQPFPGPGKKVRISTGGGGEPRWRRDGKELFYLTLNGMLMSVATRAGATTIEPGVPQPLFRTPIAAVQLTIDQYDITADGQRFLIIEPAAPPLKRRSRSSSTGQPV